MGLEKRLFSSESVTAGHPDKICDQISDGFLDEALKQDPNARVALETGAKNNLIVLLGEVTTIGYVEPNDLVKGIIRKIGYNNPDYGLDWRSVTVGGFIDRQSPDIAQGVNEGEGLHKEQGAGDQGHMFGFAIRETSELMPLPITLAHALAKRLENVRKEGIIEYLRPDGKTQVTIEYDENGKPLGIDKIVVSAQHHDGINHGQIVEDIKRHVIMPVVGDRVSSSTGYLINATGRFVIGGPTGDAGVTGRKIIVDTYGGGNPYFGGRHGGGAFSGKDASKVDRSAAYAARYIAKNIVESGLADICEVQITYAIGFAEPVSVFVNTFGTAHGITDDQLVKKIRDNFPLKPADIINHFGLKNPNGWSYLQTAAYGHFGRPEFPWERTDKVADLRH